MTMHRRDPLVAAALWQRFKRSPYAERLTVAMQRRRDFSHYVIRNTSLCFLTFSVRYSARWRSKHIESIALLTTDSSFPQAFALRQPSRERGTAAVVTVPLIVRNDALSVDRHLHVTLEAPSEYAATVQRDGHYPAVIRPDVERLAHDFPLVGGVSPCPNQDVDRLSDDFLKSGIQARGSASAQQRDSSENSDFHRRSLTRLNCYRQGTAIAEGFFCRCDIARINPNEVAIGVPT
jgi:hypothetical protein